MIDLLAGTVKHFFPKFNRWLGKLPDRRDPCRTTYTVAHLVWEELLMFLCGVGSRNAMVSESLPAGFVRTLLDLSGSHEEAAAHPDTPYAYLRGLHPSHLVHFQSRLVKRLLRMRCLEAFRFDGEWLVAVDATWLRTYSRQHCSKCLHVTRPDGTKRWMHAVLEAKLILSNGMVISLASVSIENSRLNINTDRQDCELAAFPRLAEKLKKLYPRLPVCLTADSLYACEPVMEVCRRYNWSYIAVLKPGRTPALWKRAEEKAVRNGEHAHEPGDGTVQRFRWATGLKHEGHDTHALFCDEVDPDGRPHRWAWITDHRPGPERAAFIANQGGRPRWKIENEGFNTQKNGEFELKHDYGSKGHCWYNDYLVVQIAHLLVQLVRYGNLIKKLSKGAWDTFGRAYPTMRCFVARLRESVQRDGVSEPIRGPLPLNVHIRIDSS